MYFLYFTLTDGFVAPVIDMFSVAAPPQAKGQVMGYFVTVMSISNLAMPLVIAAMLQTPINLPNVSRVLTINCVTANGLAMISFFIAARHFATEVEA